MKKGQNFPASAKNAAARRTLPSRSRLDLLRLGLPDGPLAIDPKVPRGVAAAATIERVWRHRRAQKL